MSILAFLVAISLLVAVHELGHFLVGRWCGMKVLRYSIGFGRPLWSTVLGKDRTEFWISAIPLGGYVKFLDEREGPVDPADRDRAFTRRPVPARIAVLLAGPGFNFLFAVLAYWALFVVGVPSMVPTVGEVRPASYAAEAGLERGDRLLEVGGRRVADWQAALIAMFEEMVGDGEIPLVVEREGEERELVIDVGRDAARLTNPDVPLHEALGFGPWQPPAVVASVNEGGAAEAAGIEAGDRIVAVAGEPVADLGDLHRLVGARPGATVPVEVDRDGRLLTLEVTIEAREVAGEERGFLGVGIETPRELYYERRYGPVGALAASLDRTVETTVFTVRMLARMVVGDVSVRNLSGPFNIAQYAGASAAQGPDVFVSFLALVSLSLGVLNLLPIPVLDGGQIVYQLIELVKGSPLSERAQIIGQQIGLVVLLLLMTFAFYNDIARFLG
ncbi:MAG TPA: RIP metalloprotease RseP [Woeseiaceae bacterium]|nr:RIP metalloprotease RseP [Woeseiaceae bacterium]